MCAPQKYGRHRSTKQSLRCAVLCCAVGRGPDEALHVTARIHAHVNQQVSIMGRRTTKTSTKTPHTCTSLGSCYTYTSAQPHPQALVRDCRPNALAVAAAGGIAPLAALLEAAAEPQPGLWRRCVDLWLGLGGLPALGKLLGHKVGKRVY